MIKMENKEFTIKLLIEFEAPKNDIKKIKAYFRKNGYFLTNVVELIY